jgi:secreted PhoX family phosphatase
MVEYTRRQLLESSVAAAALATGAAGTASATPEYDDENPTTPFVDGELKRFSTTARGAEVTGPFVFETGELLYSLQSPSNDNPAPFDIGGTGVFEGFQFEFDGSNDDFDELPAPRSESEQRKMLSAAGEYTFLAQYGDEINGGTEKWGQPQTPDGENIPRGDSMDMNFFVSTNEYGTEGYLFTNNENTPGSITRTPISRGEDGWESDLGNAENLENHESFREIGGTKINCYGDLSPWETPLSAEEEYGHPRVGGVATVSDIVEAGSGVGLRGGSEFWNRPNLGTLGDSLEELFGEDWGPMGVWGVSGVERLAKYLGADVPDRTNPDEEFTPIEGPFPNRYRYGRIVEIADPTAAEPNPVKHHVFGRAAWECPEVMPDERTVYLASDGGAKGVYKFVAEEPIPSYDSRMDVRGTLYAIKVTEVGEGPVAETPLDVEWLELGTASNAEIESWIAEYDDVTQVEYLETHADTDWQDDLEQALREADEEVAVNGNQDYITDQEVVEWAQQYEARGPDGVDEELRHVPFLETRAAAKEIGASVEFNKAEGIDAHDAAEPGDFVYFGISSLGGYMTDDEGELRLDEVDSGVVYRAELEEDYDVSRLEPAVVGPNDSDPQSVKDVSLVNVDNVMVMDDHRVLLCEDKGGFGRSYPNDTLWVYQPPVSVDVDSIAIPSGKTGEVDVTAASIPAGIAGGKLTVSVTHPEVATITDASLPDGVGLAEGPTIDEDGASVSLRFADIDGSIEPGDVDAVLATLEITAQSGGTADLTVTVDALDDDEGDGLDVQERSGVVLAGPPPVRGGNAPTDPDGDGKFEDLNGNGRLDYDDVTLLFEHIEDDAVRLHVDAYDFNENGKIDYDEVTELYGEL